MDTFEPTQLDLPVVAGVDGSRNGRATVDNLARGQYSARVIAKGYSFDRPIVLSRNQYIDLPILTFLDLAVLGGVGLTVIVGMLAVRARTRRVRLLAAKRTLCGV